MKSSTYVFIIVVLILTASCSKIRSITDVVTKPSAREIYARNFDKANIYYLQWQNESEKAIRNNLKIEIPSVVNGYYSSTNPSALGYYLELEKGEELWIDINTSVDSSLVFIDVYPLVNDSIIENNPIVSSDWNIKQINFSIKSTGTYKVVIQSGLGSSGSYSYKIYTQPTMAFPVVDMGNESIQSYWGANRDAGRRSHEGLDIFSARGTPVIAATDGFISFSGEKGLGGKQVWLRNGIFAYSLYYAHLDSVSVSSGKRVKLGDTLGFVGNTGNARTTAPHLHFGIYTSGGAINPLPFIEKQSIPDFEIPDSGMIGITKLSKNELRIGPEVTYEKVATLSSKDTLQIYGKIDNWYHVKSGEDIEGFMHSSLINLQ